MSIYFKIKRSKSHKIHVKIVIYLINYKNLKKYSTGRFDTPTDKPIYSTNIIVRWKINIEDLIRDEK